MYSFFTCAEPSPKSNRGNRATLKALGGGFGHPILLIGGGQTIPKGHESGSATSKLAPPHILVFFSLIFKLF
jgi:hypothetical protein